MWGRRVSPGCPLGHHLVTLDRESEWQLVFPSVDGRTGQIVWKEMLLASLRIEQPPPPFIFIGFQ